MEHAWLPSGKSTYDSGSSAPEEPDMPAHVFNTIGAIVTLRRSPWTSSVTTADRLETLALRRRLERYL
jgi:hypothetical protein